MTAELIAVHGFKQTGKDTLARLLVEEYGFTRMAFADRVKEAIHLIFGVELQLLFGSDEEKQQLSPVRWQDIQNVDRPHLDHPEFLSIRELLQIFATEMCRDKIPSIWYRYLPMKEGQKVVISDLRFQNEADFLREKQATLIKVTRPGVKSTGHESELGLPDESMDHLIDNDGSLESFLEKGRKLFKSMGLSPVHG